MVRAFVDDSLDHVHARSFDEDVAEVQDELALVILRAWFTFLFASRSTSSVLWKNISVRAVGAMLSWIDKLDVSKHVLDGVQNTLNFTARCQIRES